MLSPYALPVQHASAGHRRRERAEGVRIGGLVTAGGDRAAITAAVLIYRTLT